MKHRTSEQLYAYWNEVRQGRPAPRRFEIEPGRISEALPSTFILERATDLRLTFRLAGTRICEQVGAELRGSDFLTVWTPHDRPAIERAIREAAERGGVAWIEATAGTADQHRTVQFEILVLPLLHKTSVPDRFLGAWSALAPPSWLGAEPLTSIGLDRIEIIWPDGRPHDVLARSDNQAPFLPHIRFSRLVRADRRQFRVYDGGLANTDRKPESS